MVGVLPDQDVPDAEGEAFRVKKVGEELGEGALDLGGRVATVEFEESVHQAELGRAELVFVQDA